MNAAVVEIDNTAVRVKSLLDIEPEAFISGYIEGRYPFDILEFLFESGLSFSGRKAKKPQAAYPYAETHKKMSTTGHHPYPPVS